ncbi:MAG: cobalamin-dependent protein [Thermodesulfovibrionales bacterium]|nr:cobalamin-dependent protein [Thermodesulfovibrionales bacterium]
MVPPILEYLAALTRRAMPDVEIELIDANVTDADADAIDADLVGISVMTTKVPWVYGFADELRARGKMVVMGGIHPTALPGEAAAHADSVVVGEAESVWADVLSDARSGMLKPFYYGERLPLDDMPLPLTGLLKGRYVFRALFTKRGCPYNCTFCSVKKFFGSQIRYRPIKKVVEEAEKCMGRVYFNGDDNIWGGDVSRAIEMFNALSTGSKKYWYGFGDLSTPQVADGDKLLKAARRSGLFSVWVGWETSSTDTLKAYHASAKQGKDREDAIRRIKDHGIEVILFVMLGARTEDADEFKRTIEVADKLGVGVHPALLTPLPGTDLYEEYKPYLLDDKGWEYYTGANAVFRHPQMTPEEMEEQFFSMSLSLLSRKRIFSHLFESRAGFPLTHMLTLIRDLRIRKAMHAAYDNWKLKLT